MLANPSLLVTQPVQHRHLMEVSFQRFRDARTGGWRRIVKYPSRIRTISYEEIFECSTSGGQRLFDRLFEGFIANIARKHRSAYLICWGSANPKFFRLFVLFQNLLSIVS